MDDVDAEIDHRLATVRVPGSPNSITAPELREWVIGHLSRYDEELSRFPELAGKPHWNLWMRDTDSENALFAVMVFSPEGVEFYCGSGDSYAVLEWSTNTQSDPDKVVSEMRSQFRVAQDGLMIDRAAAEKWLGRNW